MGTVCEACGDEGFDEALVYCDSCKIGAVHRYCCGITPVPIHDYVIWFCSECEESDTGFDDCKEEDSNHTPSGLDDEHYELEDSSSNAGSIEVSSAPPPVLETMGESERRVFSGSSKSNKLIGFVGNEASVLAKNEKEKKKKRKSISHSLPDATNVVPAEVSNKRDESDTGQSDELTGLVRNEVSVLDKSEKRRKKKKKINEESSSHTSPVLDSDDHGLQDATSAEHMNASKKRKLSDGFQEATIAEPMNESKKVKTSDSRNSDELNGLARNQVSVLEKCEKKEEDTSSNHPSPVLAVQCATNVEPPKPQESSGSGKPQESAGSAKSGASVSESGNSSTVPDHNSCTTSKKRRLSSGNIRVTSVNTHLASDSSSCKEAESNTRQTNEVLTATDFNSPVPNRALPIFEPIWKGSMSVKHGNICSVDGLVAHLSSLACHKVHEKASSFHACLAAEMFQRLKIWPESFLKNGPPTVESVALYFIPSRDSKDKKVYYSLVDDMKKNDLGMKCVLDNVELLLFTSYQLPMDCWKFHSKEYLWGIFRRRKTTRR